MPHTGQVPSTAATALSRGQWHLIALSALLAAVGALAAIGAPDEIRHLVEMPPALMFVVLAVLFAVTESAKFHVEVRQQALSVSLSDLPLVIGLFTMDLEWLLVARLMSAAVVLYVRQQPVDKTFFNLSLYTLEIGVAYFLYGVVTDLWTPCPRPG